MMDEWEDEEKKDVEAVLSLKSFHSPEKPVPGQKIEGKAVRTVHRFNWESKILRGYKKDLDQKIKDKKSEYADSMSHVLVPGVKTMTAAPKNAPNWCVSKRVKEANKTI